MKGSILRPHSLSSPSPKMIHIVCQLALHRQLMMILNMASYLSFMAFQSYQPETAFYCECICRFQKLYLWEIPSSWQEKISDVGFEDYSRQRDHSHHHAESAIMKQAAIDRIIKEQTFHTRIRLHFNQWKYSCYLNRKLPAIFCPCRIKSQPTIFFYIQKGSSYLA